MSQIFTLIISIVALQFAICFAGCPRAITLRFEQFDAVEIVKENTAFADKFQTALNKMNTRAGTPESLETIVDFERRERVLQQEEKALKKEEALLTNKGHSTKPEGLRNQQKKFQENWIVLEKMKGEIAAKLVEAGKIVFVPGPTDCIMVPVELEDIFEQIEENGILIRCKYANPMPGVHLENLIKDAYVVRITSIGHGPFKIFCKSLEFKMPSNTLVHTLGAVHKGNFSLDIDSETIKKHDLTILDNQASNRLNSKTISELMILYIGRPLIPTFVPELKLSNDTPGLKAITGIIKHVSLMISLEYPKADGTTERLDIKQSGEQLKTLQDKTLNMITEIEQAGMARGNKLTLDDIRVKFTLTFTYSN